MTIKEKIKSKYINKRNGYYLTHLWKNGIVNKLYIHQIVTMAFLDHKQDGYNVVVDHIDKNKLNNNLNNLRLVSNWENTKSVLYQQKYKGIIFHKRNKKWNLTINNKYISSFTTEDEAKKYKDLYERN